MLKIFRFSALLLLISFITTFCKTRNNENPVLPDCAKQIINNEITKLKLKDFLPTKKNIYTIHVFVALCDEKNQNINCGSRIAGKGNIPEYNLYWGNVPYGFKHFFMNNEEWTHIYTNEKVGDNILERVAFKNKEKNIYIVADAYKGDKIKNAIQDFIFAAGGNKPIKLNITLNENKRISLDAGGNADFLVYAGHNGLLQSEILDSTEVIFENFKRNTKISRKAVAVLSCFSKMLFTAFLQKAEAFPLLTTESTVAPEGYLIKAIIDSWIKMENESQILENIAKTYNLYHPAMRYDYIKESFSTGW